MEDEAAHRRVDIEDDEHQQRHVAHPWNGLDQRHQQQAQLGNHRHQTQHPEDAQQACQQHHLRVVHGDEAGRDDQEVEDVPTLLEEVGQIAFGGHANQQFHQKEDGDGDVQIGQPLLELTDLIVGAGTDGHGRQHDDGDHYGLEQLVTTQLFKAGLPGIEGFTHGTRSL